MIILIDFSSCPESTRPDQKRSCILLCKVDCIVTPFSEWSPCPKSCSPSKYKYISLSTFICFCLFDYSQNLFFQQISLLAPSPDIGSSFRGRPVVVRNVQPHFSRRENVTHNLCVQYTGATCCFNVS